MLEQLVEDEEDKEEDKELLELDLERPRYTGTGCWFLIGSLAMQSITLFSEYKGNSFSMFSFLFSYYEAGC